MFKPQTGGITLPAGIILPQTNAASLPSGWSVFSSADARYIVGAGSTYAVGATGGTGAITPTAGTGGSHTGSLIAYAFSGTYVGTTTNAAHSHTWSDVTPLPPYSFFRMIKADSETPTLPQYTCLMKQDTGAWSGLTRYVPPTENRLMGADSSVGTGGTASSITTGASANAHTHGSKGGVYLSGGNANAKHEINHTDGAHTHTKTFTWTYTQYRRILNLYYYAASSGAIPEGSIIGLYENVTPPAGWSLCDGTSGTPDMRDKFAELSTSDSSGAAGDGKVTASSGASSSDGGHYHSDLSRGGSKGVGTRYHADTVGAHTHTLTAIDQTWLPSYYGLAFIMYTG